MGENERRKNGPQSQSKGIKGLGREPHPMSRGDFGISLDQTDLKT